MTVKLSQDSFVSLLEKSGLISRAALAALVDEFRAQEGSGADEGERFAQFLVRQGELTTWQARKLLQGKHKGFTLGKYKLLSLLGRGGMSSVYLAEHVVMRRHCAIKVLPSKQVNDSAALTRFHQEAQAVAALDDPNIVRAYDVDKVVDGHAEIHFLVMEYVEGRSLQELVDQDGPLSIPDAVNYICQAASGLHHAHQAGMVHRDIKPGNLLLDLNGTVKVLDMGLARFFEQTDQQSLTLQHDQRVLGTADYLSPEQAVDSHGVDTRSDIYSLGGTLYFLLSGHPPFPDGTLAQRLLAHQTRPPKPISEERPDIPASFVRILDRMMAKRPADRPASAGEARDQLLAWLSEHGDSFAAAHVPAKRFQQMPRRPAAPTAAGWADLSRESFTPPPVTDSRATGQAAEDSRVVGDRELGKFLSGLSTDIDPARIESNRMQGARTVVSPTRRKTLAVPQPVAEADAAETPVTADSRIGRDIADSKSIRDSRIARRRRTNLPLPVLAAGGGVLALLLIGYVFWPGASPESPATPGASTAVSGGANSPQAATSPSVSDVVRPPVEAGGDISVGPQGNFATINEAIRYVRDHFQPFSATDERTIRVAGGEVYPESIAIDNSQFGAFPQGVRIVCDDAVPAVLAPSGSDPIIALVNLDRFHLRGFQLSGAGRPVGVRLEGYLVNSVFEKLIIEDVQAVALQAVGISGFPKRQTQFRDLLIRRMAPEAIGLAFDGADRATKELRISGCRFGGRLDTAILLAGEATNVAVEQCRFDRVARPVRFAPTQSGFENISLSNNTFRGFERAISFTAPPVLGSRGIGFHKNLFTGVGGPEVVVEGSSHAPAPEALWKGLGAAHNWTEGTGGTATGDVDIFQNAGRRGIASVGYVSTEVEDADDFLKPENQELRQAAQSMPPPKFIGAVPPGGG